MNPIRLAQTSGSAYPTPPVGAGSRFGAPSMSGAMAYFGYGDGDAARAPRPMTPAAGDRERMRCCGQHGHGVFVSTEGFGTMGNPRPLARGRDDPCHPASWAPMGPTTRVPQSVQGADVAGRLADGLALARPRP